MNFSALGYWPLPYRCVAHLEDKKTAKMEKVKLAKERLLRHSDNGDLDCSQWRLSSVTDIVHPGCELYLNSHVTNVRSDSLRLFSHEPAVRV